MPNWSFEQNIDCSTPVLRNAVDWCSVSSDVNGRIVYENKLLVTNALASFDIDVKSGIYFVKIHDSSLNKTLIKKLVVQQ